MRLTNVFLNEIRHETTTTRRLIERVPEEHFDWRPHPKSWTLRELASHIVEILNWTVPTVKDTELELTGNSRAWLAKSTSELVERFDKNTQAATSALEAIDDDEALLVPWTLKANGTTLFTMPRMAVLRGFVISHHIHHRGQLSVYLRLKDVPLPQIYGPSADEPIPGMQATRQS